MKKTFILISMLMVAALVLSACAGAANNQDLTPAPGEMTPGVGTDLDVTPVDDVVVETPVVEPTLVEPTAAPDAVTPDVEATPADGAVVEETPVSEVPVTGDDDCNPNRLQGLLDMDVVDANGEQIGDVDQLIVLRDTRVVDEDVLDDDANTTTTGDAVLTPTVAAGDVAPAGEAVMERAFVMDTAAPRIAYVVIDLENEDDELVVPFGAFDMTLFDRDVPATTDGTVNDAANELDVCVLTFNSTFTADMLGNAPLWDAELDLSVDGWDEPYRTFWSEQGVVFNDADFANLGNAVVLGDSFNNIDVRNLNGDDLGEVEDFIVNQTTGQFDYAILATGGFLGIGERYIPVPMNMVNWVVEEADEMDETGYMIINIADEEWENAPVIESLDELDTTVDGWDEDIQSFWNNLTGTTNE